MIWIVALLFAIFALPNTGTSAETSLSTDNTLILGNGQKAYSVGSYSFKVQSDEGQDRISDILESPGNIEGAEKQSRKIVHLGNDGQPQWLVFKVINQSSVTDWVLDLGGNFDGRFGVLNEAQAYVRVPPMESFAASTPRITRAENIGQAFSFKIQRGKEATIALHVTPERGMPTTLPLKFMTIGEYTKVSANPINPDLIMTLFLVGMAFFFLAVSYVKRSWKYTAFYAYYLLLSAFFNWNNAVAFSSLSFIAETVPALIALTAIAGLWTTKAFLDITYDQYAERYTIFGFMGISLFCLLLALIDPFGWPIVRTFLILGPPMFTFLIITFMTVVQIREGRYNGRAFLWGWVAFCVGYTTSLFVLFGVLTPTAPMLNAFWLSLIPQALFFVIATGSVFETQEEENRKLKAQETKAATTVARLRESRENAEQARLLRVIEKEREALGELRRMEAQRTEEMRLAKDAADQANRDKSAFLAVVSHEIRTPMNGIMGMVKMLLDSDLDSDQKDYATTIQDSGDAMLGLLNDILDFEKIERGKMEIENINFNLHRLIQSVVTLMKGHAVSKGLFLKSDISDDLPTYVKGDPTRLRQVLLNLTGNAIKFTSEGGITLHVKTTFAENKKSEDDDRIEIYFAVEDNGIGIPKDAQKNLFNPFAQADTSISRKFGGTGLGLAISKGLIEAMGSTIGINSDEGKGSTFFFSLLMKPGQEMPQEISDGGKTEEQPKKEEKPMQILIVDDNDINRKVVMSFLGKTVHVGHMVSSAEEALERLQSEDFDAILMDIEMPGMCGDEATRIIRSFQEDKKANIPVIALTGNMMPDDQKRYFAAGMNDILAKPLEPHKLKEMLQKVQKGTLENPDPTPSEYKEQNVVSEPVQEQQAPKADEGSTTPDMEQDTGLSLQEAHPEIDSSLSPEEIQEQMQISESELETDSFAESMVLIEERQQEEIAVTDNVFDATALETLKDHLGRDSLQSMLEEVIEKTQEIVEALNVAVAKGDIESIAARAHELKGMAGNFGLREISSMAAKAEKKAKANEIDGLDLLLASLPEAETRAADALNNWVAE